MLSFFQETIYKVAYRKVENNDYAFLNSNGKIEYKLLNTRRRYWYADPIVFSENGHNWLFVEKMDRLTKIGCISVAEIKGDSIGDFVDVINEPFHLSYPMVFKKDGKIYMIPESTSDRSVILYECEEFPYKWNKSKILFSDVLYTDSNILYSNNHLYFITGEMDPLIGSKTKTLVFNADNIENGELIPLECNACRDYSYEERGAGTIFEYNSKLIRPVQCGDDHQYGKSLNFEEISIGESFKSKILSSLSIDRISVNIKRTLTGTHTYGFIDDIEIIDVQYDKIVSLPVFITRVIRKARRLLKR